MSAPVIMMGGLFSSCIVCILISCVLAVTYNGWCKSLNACEWFPFLRREKTSPPDTPPVTPTNPTNPTPSNPGPPPTEPGIPVAGSPDNPNPAPQCQRQTCSDGFVAHCGCSCENPWWNGRACTKRPAGSPPSAPNPPAPPPAQTINCKTQATTNTGYFASCNGTRGQARDRCIGTNKATCMRQPGAVW